MASMYISPSCAAYLAVIAGLQPHPEHGFISSGKPVAADAIGWFLCGAYGLDFGVPKDSERVLMAGRVLAIRADYFRKLNELDKAMRKVDQLSDTPGMFDEGKLIGLKISEISARS